MNQSDIDELTQATAEVVHSYIERVVAPLVERNAVLEARLAQVEKRAEPVSFDVISESVSKLVAPLLMRLEQVEARPLPENGKDGASITIDDVAPLIAAEVAKSVSAIPAPKDGKDGLDGKDGRDGVDGKDGKDAPEVTDEQIAEAVARYLTSNPPPAGKDGRDGADGKDGRDGVDGKPGEKGADGRDGTDGKDGANGRDGVGVAGAVIDRAGNLVLTLTDGSTRDLGVVIGKDGQPGKDGKDGAPGRDGVGFDDLDLVESDEGVLLRFTRGDQVKSFRLPIVVDRGVWREGQYRKGDGVTWAGSFWIAQEDTTEKPDTGKGWRLAVKKGRDGKDGK